MRTYGKLFFSHEEIRGEYDEVVQPKGWVMPELEAHVRIKLKALFPKIPTHKTPPYSFDDTPEAAIDLDWFLQRYPLEMSEEDHKRLLENKERFLFKVAELERILKPNYTPREVKFIRGEPRKYQSQAADLYIHNGVLLLGDDVGLGKTVSAIASFTDSRTLPVVVVVQTHLPAQWKEQIEKFLDVRIHLIKGRTPYSLPEADVYIIKYSCLASWSDTYEMGFYNSVVFDEIQELRCEGSQKYEAGQILARNAKYVLGLSATPIYNKGSEIWNIMNLMKEGCIGSYSDFTREWCEFGGTVKDPQALGSHLRERYLFLRRTKQEVKRELPPINKIVHTVDHDGKKLEEVEKIAYTLAVQATSGSFVERGQAARELDIKVRQATGISKAKSVAQYVRILLENNEPVLLAGWHREVYNIWNEELAEFNPVMYTGSESGPQKEAARQKFINGESNLMIISLRSGVGLDGLQYSRCKTVIIGELDWSPAVHEQLIGRINRDGQTDPITVIYLVSNEGSDLPMTSLLGLKADQARGIIDPMRPLEQQYSDDSRLKLLAQMYLEKHNAKRKPKESPSNDGHLPETTSLPLFRVDA